ncbi:MAG: hypothetical protein F4066_02290 [Chloroflexi bacterium]|nr:hypothetical protein [Chloroflexota bacterium]MYI03675.1 hypothetical protein [Chloroflexota bacterium]
MAAPDNKKPTAFVIMPFTPDLQSVFDSFYRKTLEANGMAVQRADNSQNSQAITKDIVLSIRGSDLIIADLTDANANVYYELGLAHAMNKPVIMLAQDVDDLKFDLRAYRCLIYSTHFEDMDEARQALSERIASFLNGSLQFGSPVSDALSTPVNVPPRQVELPVGETPDDDELGSVDYAIRLEEGTTALASSIARFGEETKSFTGELQMASAEMQEKMAQPQQISNRERRRVFRSLAEKMEDYAGFLARENTCYAQGLDQTESALDGLLNGSEALSGSDSAEVKRLRDVLAETERSTVEFEQSISGAADSTEAMPRVERTLNRARNETVRQLHTLAEFASRTASVLARARRTLDARLESAP